MEHTNETTNNTSNSLIKINQIVNENVQKTWRLQAHLKYLKTECGNLDIEIKDLKAKIEAESQTCKDFEENLEYALKIKDVEMYAVDLAIKMHPQLVQREIDEKNKLKEWTDKFESTYDEHLQKFEQFKRDTEVKNPLLKKLRNVNTEIKKLEFDKKFLKEKIKDARRIFELKKEIYQNIFYAIMVKFAQSVSNYHHRRNIMNELKENEILMENQHNQYKRKYLETEIENKRVSDNISNKIEIDKFNLQLPGNLMLNAYQSILPTIPQRSSYQNHELPDPDISSILTKYKKKSEERNEMTRKVDLLTMKKSNPAMAIKSNEIKPKKIQSAKRSLEDAQSTKPVKKSFKPQKNVTAGPEICNQTKPQGIMKKNVENENINKHIILSQKSVTKQVGFKIKDDNPTERTLKNDKIITSNKLQENLTQSQSDKTKFTPNTENSKILAASRDFNFMLSGQESQVQENTKQIVNTQNKTDLKFPTVLSSFDFGNRFQISRERNAVANKKPEQNLVATKNVENPESGKFFLKSSNSDAMEKQSREFSPYFRKSESLRQELQLDKTNRSEEQERAKNVTITASDLAECDSEAEQYLSYEFLSPQDELSATQNITFLGEDQHEDVGEEQSGFVFNLGQPSSQSSFRPFSFFN